jgi:hypothetical protein
MGYAQAENGVPCLFGEGCIHEAERHSEQS